MHGSGAIGLLGATAEQLPYYSAQGFADCAKFAIASAGYALDLIGQYDDIVDERFKRLNQEIAAIQFDSMPGDERNRVLDEALGQT